MHKVAMDWISRFRTNDRLWILDIGGRDINGTPRHLFPYCHYVVLDLRSGPNVDIIADAATWIPDRLYDLVICAEVFEHTPDWQAICRTAFSALKSKGKFVVTAAGPGRPEHSAIRDGWGLEPGEFYKNIEPEELRLVLVEVGFVDVLIDTFEDVRSLGVRL